MPELAAAESNSLSLDTSIPSDSGAKLKIEEAVARWIASPDRSWCLPTTVTAPFRIASVNGANRKVSGISWLKPRQHVIGNTLAELPAFYQTEDARGQFQNGAE